MGFEIARHRALDKADDRSLVSVVMRCMTHGRWSIRNIISFHLVNHAIINAGRMEPCHSIRYDIPYITFMTGLKKKQSCIFRLCVITYMNSYRCYRTNSKQQWYMQRMDTTPSEDLALKAAML